MSTFTLTIVSPFGMPYQGYAELLTVKTTEGEATILANHINYAAALDNGMVTAVIDGAHRYGACSGGMLSMTENCARLIAKTFEWQEEIDVERAQDALNRAEAALQQSSLSNEERLFHLAAKKRAEIRIKTSKMNAG